MTMVVHNLAGKSHSLDACLSNRGRRTSLSALRIELGTRNWGSEPQDRKCGDLLLIPIA